MLWFHEHLVGLWSSEAGFMSWSWFHNLEFSVRSLREDLTSGFLTYYLTSWGVASRLAGTVLCVPLYISVITKVQPLTSETLWDFLLWVVTYCFTVVSHILGDWIQCVDPEDTYVTLQGLLDTDQLRHHVIKLCSYWESEVLSVVKHVINLRWRDLLKLWWLNGSFLIIWIRLSTLTHILTFYIITHDHNATLMLD